MPYLSGEVRHVVQVLNGSTPVTGLTIVDFTVTLKRQVGATLVGASELVSLQEIVADPGKYWFFYTPTQVTLYEITIASDLYSVNPYTFQDLVEAAPAATSGPYLSTVAEVKNALKVPDDADDGRILSLLAAVTSWAQAYCRCSLFAGTWTKYPRIAGNPVTRVFLNEAPIISFAGVWLSTAIPRVYDAAAELVEGEDFLIDDEGRAGGWIDLVSPVFLAPRIPTTNLLKVTFDAGHATIPPALERAAIETILPKLAKGKNDLYHLTQRERGEGRIDGIRFEDVPPHTLRVFDLYRLPRAA